MTKCKLILSPAKEVDTKAKYLLSAFKECGCDCKMMKHGICNKIIVSFEKEPPSLLHYLAADDDITIVTVKEDISDNLYNILLSYSRASYGLPNINKEIKDEIAKLMKEFHITNYTIKNFEIFNIIYWTISWVDKDGKIQIYNH